VDSESHAGWLPEKLVKNEAPRKLCSQFRSVGFFVGWYKIPKALIGPVSLVAGERKAYHRSWMKHTYNAPAQDPLTADLLLREEPDEEEEDEEHDDGEEDDDGDEGYSE
jgi:hypothetical protein